MELAERVEQLQEICDGNWAWVNYLDLIREIIGSLPVKSIVEIGGGRAPSFDKTEIEAMGADYTSNDISARELSLAPSWVGKALFDIQTSNLADIDPYLNKYDLVFSKMVMEHVADYERAYQNIYKILRVGGISVAFHPVLYSLPFVLNRLLPGTASDLILRKFFPNRNDSGTPKFPAVYSGCRISAVVRNNIKKLGFREVWQVPFYGHNYYSRLPVVREVHAKLDKLIMKRRITPLATFAYTIAQK